MNTHRKLALGLLALLPLMPLAQAAEPVSITVPNFSFQQGAALGIAPVISPSASAEQPAGWQEAVVTVGGVATPYIHPASGTPRWYVQNTSGTAGAVGNRDGRLQLGAGDNSVLVLSHSGDVNGETPILPVFQANTIYTLTVSFAVSTAAAKTASVGFYNATTNAAIMTSTPVTFTTISSARSEVAATTTTPTLAAAASGAFRDYGIILDTSLPQYAGIIGTAFQIGVKATSAASHNTSAGLRIDNVRLTSLSLIPEPSTWALLLGGVSLVSVICVRRRR